MSEPLIAVAPPKDYPQIIQPDPGRSYQTDTCQMVNTGLSAFGMLSILFLVVVGAYVFAAVAMRICDFIVPSKYKG